MLPNKTEYLQSIQAVINTLRACMEWDDKAFLEAQAIGLQGEKRRDCHEECKTLMLSQWLRRKTGDLFDVKVLPEPVQVNLPSEMSTIPGYFNAYLNKMEETYSGLHKQANVLVNMGYQPIAKKLYKYTCHLMKIIIEVRRIIKEGKLANWEYHHVSRYQVSFDNVHDRYECKEKKMGYPG